MNKLSILLQQLHIDTNQAFSQADITRVVVHHDSRYTFYISSPELMPLSNVKALKEAQHLFPYPCEFFFETTFKPRPFFSLSLSLHLTSLVESFHLSLSLFFNPFFT